jgi:hypothetical protein
MHEQRGQFEDGSIVTVVSMSRKELPILFVGVTPRFVVDSGEQLLPHPHDTDGTLFVTARTGKNLRLLK